MLAGTQTQYDKIFRDMISQLKRGPEIVIRKWNQHSFQYCYNYIFGFRYKLHLRPYNLFLDSRVERIGLLSLENSKKARGMRRLSKIIIRNRNRRII